MDGCGAQRCERLWLHGVVQESSQARPDGSAEGSSSHRAYCPQSKTLHSVSSLGQPFERTGKDMDARFDGFWCCEFFGAMTDPISARYEHHCCWSDQRHEERVMVCSADHFQTCYVDGTAGVLYGGNHRRIL